MSLSHLCIIVGADSTLRRSLLEHLARKHEVWLLDEQGTAADLPNGVRVLENASTITREVLDQYKRCTCIVFSSLATRPDNFPFWFWLNMRPTKDHLSLVGSDADFQRLPGNVRYTARRCEVSCHSKLTPRLRPRPPYRFTFYSLQSA